jgi:hypothetical protein
MWDPHINFFLFFLFPFLFPLSFSFIHWTVDGAVQQARGCAFLDPAKRTRGGPVTGVPRDTTTEPARGWGARPRRPSSRPRAMAENARGRGARTRRPSSRPRATAGVACPDLARRAERDSRRRTERRGRLPGCATAGPPR